MSMEAVGGESEVFPEGPWMQDWTTFPLSFSNSARPFSADAWLIKPVFDGPATRSLALGIETDFFI